MTKEETTSLIINKLVNDLNNHDMQIQQGTITDIANECGTTQPCILAMQFVAEWFNSHRFGSKPKKAAEKYVGALANMLELLATNNVAEFVKNWSVCNEG